jgi:hypothetical protein
MPPFQGPVVRTLVVLVFVVLEGCRADSPARAKASEAEGCDAGIRLALEAKNRADAIHVFLRGCSGLFEDDECRDALRHAGGSVSDDWLMGSVSACAKAYCPNLSSEVAACRTGSIEGPDAIDQAFIELSHAVLKREDDQAAAGVVMAFARFFAQLNTRLPPRRGGHGVSLEAVERCEQSIERAVSSPAPGEKFYVYYEGCAPLYVGECRAAFKAAAGTQLEYQTAVALLGCRTAYCYWLSNPPPEACDGEFVPTPEAVARAWPVLHRRILELDAQEYVPRLMTAMARLDE